jgi:Xaa-Pro aminopeptidase
MESELRAYREVLRAAKPGVMLAELESIFLGVIEDDAWELGAPAWHYSYHGVGMDAIEWPYYSPMLEGNRDTAVKEGMVFSYHPHRATVPSVRRIPAIYDDFVITPDGGKQLSDNWDLSWRIMNKH